MKNTKRKGFNFFRSYFDVYNELPKKDKLEFIDALLNKQFLGIDPKGLKGMAKFAWVSQVHSINTQVKGFEDKTGIKLDPTEGGRQGGNDTPKEQVEVQEKEEVKGKGKVEYPFDSKNFIDNWNIWKEFKKKEFNFKYKSDYSEQGALIKLSELSNNNEQTAIKIIHQSISEGWKGLFELKEDGNRNNNNQRTDVDLKRSASIAVDKMLDGK